MLTLYLIDGYAQFFRAYHAIRTPMTSPVTKEPTNLTFGFIGMLLKLLRGEGKIGGTPDYLALALDVSGDTETFRSRLDPQYKAHRPPPPEDLFPQVERCLSMLREIGVPVIGAEGFEADDAIATIAARLEASADPVRVRMVSKDKDLKQLLRGERGDSAGAPVEMYDVHTDELITESTLRDETGLSPPQVVDMLALMGDTADNVKGVEGIGPKTAVELIRKYGTIESLAEHAGEIPGKRGDSLRSSLSRLPLNKQLVELRRDAPIEFDLATARVRTLRLERLLPILKELGFNRYQTELREILASLGRPLAPERAPAADSTAEGMPPPRAPADRAPPSPLAPGLFDRIDADALPGTRAGATFGVTDNWYDRYECVRTHAQLRRWIELGRAAPVIAIDTETTGLSPLTSALCGISLAVEPGLACYIPVRSPEADSHLDARSVLDALRPMLGDPDHRKTGHNLKFDMLVLRAAGVDLRGIACDTMVASFLIDSSRSSHGLDALTLALFAHANISITELIGTGARQRPFSDAPLDRAAIYAAEDADAALRLHNVMAPQLRAMGLAELCAKVEIPLVEVLAELEWNGIAVDQDELDRQRARLLKQLQEIRGRIDDAAYAALGRTLNPDSPKQLAAALFNPRDASEPGLGLKPIKKTKTGNSTDVEVLEALAEDNAITTPLPRLILEHRQLAKLVGTYLESLREAINPATGRIHTSFHQTVAATGRLASSDPNLQNIPIRTDVGREIRRAFVAPPGRVLVSADYSQIELRILAHLSRDPGLIAAFERNEDIHAAVAAQIHGVPLERVTREQRSGAKMVNFGIVYGITPFGLARRLGISNDAAAAIIDSYKRRFAGITTFLQECIEQARRHGYVETMLGRRRPVIDIDSTNPSRRALAERVAINSVVQGSAADLIKLAMIDLHRRLSPIAAHHRSGAAPEIPDVRMLLQIHDELVFESPESSAQELRALVVARMERAMQLRVPIRVDSTTAQNWYDGA
ncbi:MAG: DNA polymerase I [Phycisphaerae bacterium]|nr:DNA polymerase I [Phycisphaerae bacterium]